MKKMLLILGVLVAVVALASGMTIAYAKDNGNDVKQGNQPCGNLVLGTVMGTAGNATNGAITLLPRGQNTNQTIDVNSDTKYSLWMVPNQSVGFDKLGSGDWVAVCANNGAASLVVLLEIPEKPFHLRLEGNVTAVNGNVISGNTKGGGNFTINLTGGGNFTGAAGQPIVLDIGKNGPPAWGISRGPTMKRLMEGIGLWMRNQEGKMWRFGD
jgi:hypothetical protein